jgi:hypothetical protein
MIRAHDELSGSEGAFVSLLNNVELELVVTPGLH